VADLAEVVAVGLDAGLDLHRAVLAASLAPPVVDRAPWLHPRVAAALDGGRGVASCLGASVQPRDGPRSRGGPRPADTGLEVLARAWRLSEEVGAAASAATSAAAAVLRSRAADRRRAATLVAGPRASMWLLTALPVLGPVLGLLAGVGPGRLYESPLARASAVVGVVLAALGWLWAALLLHRAQRAGTVAGRSS
jgi:tight adherence protein B